MAGRLFEEWVDLGEDRVIRGAVWARLQALLGAQLAPETLAGTVLALSMRASAPPWAQYPCCECGKPVPVDAVEWSAMLENGAFGSWGHDGCVG